MHDYISPLYHLTLSATKFIISVNLPFRWISPLKTRRTDRDKALIIIISDV